MLLGHEKNAFTGAFERHVGQITLADAGTLFLDNVDLLPFEAQIAVLQVIEHQRVQVLGRVQPETVDVRIIAGTSVGLSSLVKSERFREDLFYKLNAVSVALPPLRERRGDIEPLVRHLLGRIIALPGMRGMGITDAAMELLTTYAWPGNVRQLGSVLLRALLACDGDALTVTEFPTIAAQTREILPAGANSYALSGSVNLFTPDGQMRPLADIEADIIRLAIGHYRGRMAEVSRRLGIGRSTLYRKLEELGLADVA
jgi:DNA-binding NtrC family response regulator